MKYLFILLTVSCTAQSVTDTLRIDIVRIYEDVIKMGYESQQIYQTLADQYARRKDTVNYKKYKMKLQ